MELWRRIWRDGIAPQLGTPGLVQLQEALRLDSPQLIQGGTTSPVHQPGSQVVEIEAACPIAYCGWRGSNLKSVADAEMYFAQVCAAADRRFGEAGACRWFLNWYDDGPRLQVRSLLLAEVRRVLAARRGMEPRSGSAA